MGADLPPAVVGELLEAVELVCEDFLVEGDQLADYFAAVGAGVGGWAGQGGVRVEIEFVPEALLDLADFYDYLDEMGQVRNVEFGILAN